MYKVRLNQFEGPLDLLLQLIQDKKLDITKVSLVEVTAQYLEHIKAFDNLLPEELARFIVVAARLIFLKSRALLPELEEELNEEEGGENITLEEKLKRLRFFKDLARELQKVEKRGLRNFGRERVFGRRIIFYPPANLNLAILREAYRKVVAAMEQEIVKHPEGKVAPKIRLDEKIKHLINLLEKDLEILFHAHIDKKNKEDIIVSFLALLELIKRQVVIVEQKNNFGYLNVKKLT